MMANNKRFYIIEVVGIFIITFLSWRFESSLIGLSIFSVLFVLNTYIFKNEKPNLFLIFFIPPLLSSLMKRGQMEDFADLSSYIYHFIPIFIYYGVIIVEIFRNRRLLKFSALNKGMIIYFALMIPGIIFTIDLYNTLLGVGIYINTVILYLYFSTRKDVTKYDFMYVSIGLAMQASLQMFALFVGDNVFDLIVDKTYTLGWSVSNNIAQYLVFAIPFIFYLGEKFKKHSLYFNILAMFAILFTIITVSRTSILALIIILGLIVIRKFRSENEDGLKSTFRILAPVFMISLIGLLYMNIPQAIISKLIESGLSSSGRLHHWTIGMHHFFDHPFIGTGLLTTSSYIWYLPTYHNIIIDTLTNTGIIGFIGLCYFSYIVIKQLRANKSSFNFYLGLSYIGLVVAALFDTVHINPITLMLFFISLHYINSKKSERI